MEREFDRFERELVRIRDRLHKLEGGQSSVAGSIRSLAAWRQEAEPVIEKIDRAQAIAETVRLRWAERLTLLIAALSGVGALLWQVLS